MATYTENYNLLVTEPEDQFDIADYNSNFETIDAVMAENEVVVNEVNDKLGTPDEGETVFSLLKSGGNSVIKSIQHVFYEGETDTTSGEISINPVDSSKSFVIFERLFDDIDCGTSQIEYTLNSSSISVTHPAYVKGWRKFGFWVIEFN